MAAENVNADPLIGKLIGGKFLVERTLGQGAMGKVYRAEQTSLAKPIALKVLRAAMADDPHLQKRFHREARAASALSHPNIVQTVDFGDEGGLMYIAMELLSGRDLRRIIRDEWPFQPDRIAHIVGQILGALDEAHAKGVVHRDLKPENVMIIDVRGESDFVKVCDFGIAKVQSERDSDGSAITSAGMVCGTPEYMSPEQARGDPLDGRSDLYAVAVILYHMVAGELPFRAESALGVVTKHLTEMPIPPSKRRPDVEVLPALEAVIMRGLEKSREGRFATAQEMKWALYEAVGMQSRRSSISAPHRRLPLPEETAQTGVSTPVPGEGDDQTASSPAVRTPTAALGSRSGPPAQNAAVSRSAAVSPSGLVSPNGPIPAAETPSAAVVPIAETGSVPQRSGSSSASGALAQPGRRAAWSVGLLLAGAGVIAGGYVLFKKPEQARTPVTPPELVLATNEPKTPPPPGTAAAAVAPEVQPAAPVAAAAPPPVENQPAAPPEANPIAPANEKPTEVAEPHAHHAAKRLKVASPHVAPPATNATAPNATKTSAPNATAPNAATANVPAANTTAPAAAKNPPPARSPFADGEVLLKSGDPEGALVKYQEAARLDPTNARVQRQIGKCYTRLGQRDRALPYFKRYLELAPDASDAPFIRAVLDGK